jgi:hypothetical protein
MTDPLEYIKKLENDLASMKAQFNIGSTDNKPPVEKKKRKNLIQMSIEERKKHNRKYQREYQKKKREKYKKDMLELKKYRNDRLEQSGKDDKKEKRREYMRRYREKKKTEKDDEVFMDCD